LEKRKGLQEKAAAARKGRRGHAEIEKASIRKKKRYRGKKRAQGEYGKKKRRPRS